MFYDSIDVQPQKDANVTRFVTWLLITSSISDARTGKSLQFGEAEDKLAQCCCQIMSIKSKLLSLLTAAGLFLSPVCRDQFERKLLSACYFNKSDQQNPITKTSREGGFWG